MTQCEISQIPKISEDVQNAEEDCYTKYKVFSIERQVEILTHGAQPWMDRKWMPGIFSMIDASRSDDPGPGWRCQVLMGHRVDEARTKESCFLRTESALSRRPLLIIGPMTGTRARFLTRSTRRRGRLRFVTKPPSALCYRKLELLWASFDSVALPLSYLSLTIPSTTAFAEPR